LGRLASTGHAAVRSSSADRAFPFFQYQAPRALRAIAVQPFLSPPVAPLVATASSNRRPRLVEPSLGEEHLAEVHETPDAIHVGGRELRQRVPHRLLGVLGLPLVAQQPSEVIARGGDGSMSVSVRFQADA
jgi:hypothetical protein